eukprot:INCI13257.1.p1 GENE.INCI13257.1~~INCI13257.1.p1  ORF type:complete len:1188 (+),score=182.98 INCI13257.1:175-3564(+)
MAAVAAPNDSSASTPDVGTPASVGGAYDSSRRSVLADPLMHFLMRRALVRTSSHPTFEFYTRLYARQPEKLHFIQSLVNFYVARRQPHLLLRAPAMCGTVLDIFRLYHCVTSRGGLQQVIQDKMMKNVLDETGIQLPVTATSSSHQLKMHYEKYLLSYELAAMFAIDISPLEQPRVPKADGSARGGASKSFSRSAHVGQMQLSRPLLKARPQVPQQRYAWGAPHAPTFSSAAARARELAAAKTPPVYVVPAHQQQRHDAAVRALERRIATAKAATEVLRKMDPQRQNGGTSNPKATAAARLRIPLPRAVRAIIDSVCHALKAAVAREGKKSVSCVPPFPAQPRMFESDNKAKRNHTGKRAAGGRGKKQAASAGAATAATRTLKDSVADLHDKKAPSDAFQPPTKRVDRRDEEVIERISALSAPNGATPTPTTVDNVVVAALDSADIAEVVWALNFLLVRSSSRAAALGADVAAASKANTGVSKPDDLVLQEHPQLFHALMRQLRAAEPAGIPSVEAVDQLVEESLAKRLARAKKAQLKKKKSNSTGTAAGAEKKKSRSKRPAAANRPQDDYHAPFLRGPWGDSEGFSLQLDPDAWSEELRSDDGVSEEVGQHGSRVLAAGSALTSTGIIRNAEESPSTNSVAGPTASRRRHNVTTVCKPQSTCAPAEQLPRVLHAQQVLGVFFNLSANLLNAKFLASNAQFLFHLFRLVRAGDVAGGNGSIGSGYAVQELAMKLIERIGFDIDLSGASFVSYGYDLRETEVPRPLTVVMSTPIGRQQAINRGTDGGAQVGGIKSTSSDGNRFPGQGRGHQGNDAVEVDTQAPLEMNAGVVSLLCAVCAANDFGLSDSLQLHSSLDRQLDQDQDPQLNLQFTTQLNSLDSVGGWPHAASALQGRRKGCLAALHAMEALSTLALNDATTKHRSISQYLEPGARLSRPFFAALASFLIPLVVLCTSCSELPHTPWGMHVDPRGEAGDNGKLRPSASGGARRRAMRLIGSFGEPHPRPALEITLAFEALRLLYRLLSRSPAPGLQLVRASLQACPCFLDLVSAVLSYDGLHSEIPLAAASVLGVFAGAAGAGEIVRSAWASPAVEQHLVQAATAGSKKGREAAASVLYQKVTILLGFLPELVA